MSMSGSLQPCVPIQAHLKFNPPKISLVYHFIDREKEQYFHDIEIDKKMLLSQTDEEICNFLYIYEPYYFDPKYIKRQSVIFESVQLILSLDHQGYQKTQRWANGEK